MDSCEVLVTFLVDKVWERLCDLLTGSRSLSRCAAVSQSKNQRSFSVSVEKSVLSFITCIPGQSRIHSILSSLWWHELGVLSCSLWFRVAAWFWENQPLEMCDLYFLSSFNWSECLDSFQCESLSLLPFSVDHFLFNIAVSLLSFHSLDSSISQAVWSRGLQHWLLL